MSKTIHPAQDCESMADVRAGIDALDRELVALLAKRQTYIEAAGRIKPKRDQVRDEARIEDVIMKVLSRAKREGLSSDIAEPVWRLLIERSIAHEYAVYDKHSPSKTLSSPDNKP